MQEGGWIANSIIDGNIATNSYARGGGGLFFYNGGGKVNSSTISYNSSTNNGAAWSHHSTYVDPGKLGDVSHSILWNNTPSASGSWDAGNNETIDPSTVSSAPGANLAISSFASVASSRSTQFKYDLNSNLMLRDLPNGVDEFRTYDALNRLVANTNFSASSAFSVVNYSYDPVGNLMQMDDSVTGLHTIPSSATWTWTYDNAYRLLSESVSASSAPLRETQFDWDAAGNREEVRRYTGGSLASTTVYKPASKLNQMMGWSSGTTNALYVYDANGNRDRKFIRIGGATASSTEYAYDEDNRLVEVTTRSTEAAKTYSFGYDYRTRRISRETPTEKTTHVFDGGLSVQEYDASQSPTPNAQSLSSESIRGEGMGGGVGGMVYSIRNGQLEASHSNHRGDVVARTDASGALSYFARYNAFGTRFDEFGATYDRQRGNTKDEETPLGLSFQGMRILDLEHGIWLTKDPAGYIDGPNRYQCVHCNPITKFDPLGLKTKSDYQDEIKDIKDQRAQAYRQAMKDGMSKDDRSKLWNSYNDKLQSRYDSIGKLEDSAAYHNKTVSQWTALYNKMNGTNIDPSKNFVDADTLDDETKLGRQVLQNHTNKKVNDALYATYAVVTLGGRATVRGSAQKAFQSGLDDAMRTSVDGVLKQTALADGEMVLAVVKDGKVIAQTKNIALSHKEFVARSLGNLPKDARVITVVKDQGRLVPFNSMSVHGNQAIAPTPVVDAVNAAFK